MQAAAWLREMTRPVARWGQHKVLVHEAARLRRDADVSEESVYSSRAALVLGMVDRSILRADVVSAAPLRRSLPEARKWLHFAERRTLHRRAPAFAEAFTIAEHADFEEGRQSRGEWRRARGAAARLSRLWAPHRMTLRLATVERSEGASGGLPRAARNSPRRCGRSGRRSSRRRTG